MNRPKSPPSLELGPIFLGLCVLGLSACSSAPTPADFAGEAGSAGTGQLGGSAGSGAGTGSGGSSGASSVVDCALAGSVPVTVEWSRINSQPASFYATAEALTLADNIVYYQNPDFGWPKDTDMTTTTARRADSTIDNRATTTQIQYLARVYTASECPKYGEAAANGISYLLAAQYDNGGFPQEYPENTGYHARITFNDDAMVRVLELLRSVGNAAEPYAFLDPTVSASAALAVEKGIDCILKCQVVSDGKKTGWCAQHDEVTFEPAMARSYELPSLSGSEAAGIVRFLMSIDQPSPEVREAIEGAVAWFEEVKLTGIKVVSTVDATQPTGEDRVVVEDPAAPPIWARFYELATNVPIFSSRCEVPECETDPFFMRRYSLAEIENERRVGYSWYGDWPASVLASEYPAWQLRWPATP